MQPLHHLSLKCKLSMVAMLVVVSLAAVASAAFWRYSRLEEGLDALYAQRLPSYRLAAALEAHVRALHGLVNQSMEFAMLGYHQSEIGRVDEAIEQTSADIKSAVYRRLRETADPTEHQAVEAIHASVSKFLQAIQDTVELRPTGVGNASTFLSTAQREYETSLRLISDMRSRRFELAGQDVAASRSSAANAKLAIVAAAIVAGAAVLLLTLAITRGTLRTIQTLLRTTHQMR